MTKQLSYRKPAAGVTGWSPSHKPVHQWEWTLPEKPGQIYPRRVTGHLFRNPDGGWGATIDEFRLFEVAGTLGTLPEEMRGELILGDTRAEAIENALEELESWLGCRVEN